MKNYLAAMVSVAMISLSSTFAVAQSGSTLNQVKARGVLKCGSNTGLAGFGIPDAQGVWHGLDIDYCRAISAAIFDDPNKVDIVPVSPKDRFTALQSGEVDVLLRNSSWTMTRETTLGLLFAGVNFYDGQGFIVKKSLGVSSASQLSGASICVQQGSTSELNIADYFRLHGMKYDSITFASNDEAIKAYESGRCDSFTTDTSALYADLLKLNVPSEHIVLPEVISKEPLGPVTRSNDLQWFSLVKWVHFALLNSEELGVTKGNLGEMLKSPNPEIKRLLGIEGDFGRNLGLTSDWAARIVKHVGNYGESFDRNFGQGSLLKVKRGQNELWAKGGLQYAPPIR